MENTTAAEPQYTYTEMPGDIARVIFGDEESHTLLNIGDVSLYDVLTKIICYTKEQEEKHKASTAVAFEITIKSIYDYMAAWWEEKPIKINYRSVYTSMRDILLGKSGSVYINFVLYAASYFEGSHENESIDKEYLSSLIEQLKAVEEYEARIIEESEEINRILKHSYILPDMMQTIRLIEERIRIDGTMDCDFFITSALFYYGYVEGKRAERAKRKVAA